MNKHLVKDSLAIQKTVKNIKKEYKKSKKPTNLKVNHALNEFYDKVFCTKLASNDVNPILWSCICDNFENLFTAESCLSSAKDQIKEDASELDKNTSDSVEDLNHDMRDLNSLINDVHAIYNANEDEEKVMDNIWFETDFDDWEEPTFTPASADNLGYVLDGVNDDINDLILKPESDKYAKANQTKQFKTWKASLK